MSNVVVRRPCPEQAQQPDANPPRPRKGRLGNGRRISMAYTGEAAEQIECRGCQHWRPFVAQWGHCACELVRRHVDGEAPLVTRASFSCRFFSPSDASVRKSEDLDLHEKLQPHVMAAAD